MPVSEPSGDEIIISSGEIASIAAIFSQTWQRAPTAAELDSLLSEHVRDEVFYRQGLAMGLDRDDAVVRRRIRQKMEFVADLTADVAPTDAELKAFVAEHPEWFRDEPRFSFDHVYFPASSGAMPDAGALADLLRDLNSGAVDASTAGSPFMAGADFRDLSKSDVARTFGEDFAASVDKAAPGAMERPGRLRLRHAPGSGHRACRSARAALRASQEGGASGSGSTSARSPPTMRCMSSSDPATSSRSRLSRPARSRSGRPG